MGTMVEHARRELDRLGEEPSFAACLVATVGAFASFGHSGGSQVEAVRLLVDLLNLRALTPLTADPAEWIDRSQISGVPMWQNERDSRAFSEDRGRTFTLVDNDDGVSGDAVYASVAPPGWVRALRERDRIGEDAAVAAVWAYLDAGPVDDTDRDALDAGDEKERTRYMLRRWGREGAPVAALLYQPTTVAALAGVE